MRRGLAAASAALLILVACDRNNEDRSSATPSAPGGAGSPSVPSPTPERAAAMQLRPVQAVVPPSDPAYESTTVTCGSEDGPTCTVDELLEAPRIVMEDAEGVRYRLGPVIVDGNDVSGAEIFRSPFGEEWAVGCLVTARAADRVAQATERIATMASPRNTVAIVAGGRLVSAPTVQGGAPSGRIQLTGAFTEREAKTLAAQLGGPVA